MKCLTTDCAYSALSAPGWGNSDPEKFFGLHWKQLGEVKRQVDPGNVFTAIPALS